MSLTDYLIAHYPNDITEGSTSEEVAIGIIERLDKTVKLQAAALEVWKSGKATKPA
jgi:hypothetical protein